MSFGLCNTLSTFTTLRNSIFHKKLDDILVYSKSTEEHAMLWSLFYKNSKRTNYMPIGQKMSLQVRKWTFWDMCYPKKG